MVNGSPEQKTTFSAVKANMLPLAQSFNSCLDAICMDPATNPDNIDFLGIVQGLPIYQKAMCELEKVREHILSDNFVESYEGERFALVRRFERSKEKMLFYPLGAYMVSHITDSLNNSDLDSLISSAMTEETIVARIMEKMYRDKGRELETSLEENDRIYTSIFKYMNNYSQVHGDNSYVSGRELLSFTLSGLVPAVYEMDEMIHLGMGWDDVKARIHGTARQNIFVGGPTDTRRKVLNGEISVAEASQLTNKTKGEVTIGCIAMPKMEEIYQIVEKVYKALR